MVTRLLAGILACVLVPLGAVFVVLGLTVDDVDQGEPEDFLATGVPLLLLGVAVAAVYLVLRRREAERRERRRSGARAQALVLEAHWRSGIRVGAWLTYDLTVRFDPAGTVSQRILVKPGTPLEEGQTLEVVYDPSDPSNFELA